MTYKLNIKTVAYSKKEAARIALEIIHEMLKPHCRGIERVEKTANAIGTWGVAGTGKPNPWSHQLTGVQK